MKKVTNELDNQWQDIVSLTPCALYWCLTEKSSHTDSFCKQVIEGVSTQKNVCYVSSKKNDQCIHELFESSSHLHTLTYYELPAHVKAYQSLAKDLLKVIKSQQNLFIIIRTSSEIWQSISKRKLNAFLTSMIDLLALERSTVLMISEGAAHKQLELDLASNRSLLNGLSKCQTRYHQLYYTTLWWQGEQRDYRERSWPVEEECNGLSLLPKQKRKVRGNVHYDESVIYAHKDVIETDELVTDRWQLLESNELIAENALNYHSATIIFAFTGEMDIFNLAKQVYHTRITCGDDLKIIVRKCSLSFRHIDMKILLNCGANLVLPFEISFSVFLTMVRELKGLHFCRQLPENINDFLTMTFLEKHKGKVSFSVFCRQVRRRVSMPLFEINDKGVLINMIPKLGISVQQAALSCQINRSGDIYAFAGKKLVIFLSMCDLSDADSVLSKIFPNTLKHLFLRYDVLSSDEDILNFLESNEHFTSEAIELGAQQSDPKHPFSNNEVEDKVLVNFVPKPMRLNLGKIE